MEASKNMVLPSDLKDYKNLIRTKTNQILMHTLSQDRELALARLRAILKAENSELHNESGLSYDKALAEVSEIIFDHPQYVIFIQATEEELATPEGREMINGLMQDHVKNHPFAMAYVEFNK